MSLPTMTLNAPQPTAPTSGAATSSARSLGASERAADFDAKVAQELGEQTQKHTTQDGSTEAAEALESILENVALIVSEAPVDQSQLAFELIVSQEPVDTSEQELAPEVVAPELIPADGEASAEVATELVEQVAAPQPGAQDVPVELVEDNTEANAAAPRNPDSAPREGAPSQQQRDGAPVPENAPQSREGAPVPENALQARDGATAPQHASAAASPTPPVSDNLTSRPAAPQPMASETVPQASDAAPVPENALQARDGATAPQHASAAASPTPPVSDNLTSRPAAPQPMASETVPQASDAAPVPENALQARDGATAPQHAPAAANPTQPVSDNLTSRPAAPQPMASETVPPVVVTNEPVTTQPNTPQQPAPTVPVVATAPVITQTPPVAEPAPVTAPPATTPAGMLEQVRGPIGRLTQAVPGEHTFTVNVTPENLGSVTVRAHIGVEGIRVELIGATDAARDSLRAILNDLKRDLQSTGMNAQLDVGSERSDARDQFGAQEFGRHAQQSSGTQADRTGTHIVENDLTTTSNNRHPGALSVDIVA